MQHVCGMVVVHLILYAASLTRFGQPQPDTNFAQLLDFGILQPIKVQSCKVLLQWPCLAIISLGSVCMCNMGRPSAVAL